MLKPVINIHGAGRKRNRSLDPGNRCITSKVFLDAVRSEANRKQKETEEKKIERARIAAEKKRETSKKERNKG